MRGIYRFYQEGRQIGEAENLITTDGKRLVMQYLAGYRGNIASHIAVGAFNTAAAVGDKELAFEWARTPIISTSPDYTNTLLVYKGRFEAVTTGVIYEAGLWSPDDVVGDYASTMLLDFDSANDVWTAGAYATNVTRIGIDSLRLSPTTSTTITAQKMDTNMDLSGYSNTDEFKFVYNVSGQIPTSVQLRFYVDASNYYTYTFTPPGTGYRLQKFYKTDLVATGTPTYNGITYVGAIATAPGTGQSFVDFDGLRIDDKDTYTDTNILVSRAVPASPITMVPNIPMEIEYSLDVTLP
jgi:hypothetical protein